MATKLKDIPLPPENETPFQILKRMRVLLDKPEAWTQHMMFGVREANNVAYPLPITLPPDDSDCCCIQGAVKICVTDEKYESIRLSVWDLLQKAAAIHFNRRFCLYLSPFWWNDSQSTTHKDIIAVLNKAIELASLEEKNNDIQAS